MFFNLKNSIKQTELDLQIEFLSRNRILNLDILILVGIGILVYAAVGILISRP